MNFTFLLEVYCAVIATKWMNNALTPPATTSVVAVKYNTRNMHSEVLKQGPTTMGSAGFWHVFGAACPACPSVLLLLKLMEP